MSATKREEVSSHLRYIRLELREMHQMLIKDDLLPDLNEAKELHAQLDALLDLLSDKRATKVKSHFWNFWLFRIDYDSLVADSIFFLLSCIFSNFL